MEHKITSTLKMQAACFIVSYLYNNNEAPYSSFFRAYDAEIQTV